jgi:hypothetical protein
VTGQTRNVTTVAARPRQTESDHVTTDADLIREMTRMANLDRLMQCREDAYNEMRRVVPQLAGDPSRMGRLTSRQVAATELFEGLDAAIRDFRSANRGLALSY